MTRLSSILFAAFTFMSANCQDIFVPSSENVFETQHSVVLPMTLECPSPRHKYIEIHGVTLTNGSDVIVANSLAPNLEQLVNEECFASLVQAENKPVKCDVAMQALPQDASTGQMDKVVTFDCKKALGDPSLNEKTVSKEKGTIKLECDDKSSVPEIIDISLASGESVSKTSSNWKCSQENINNINAGKGGKCQVKREGYLNDSEMTVKYKCSEPPRREFDEFVQGNGKGNKGNGKGNGK